MKVLKIALSTLLGLVGIVLISCIPTFFKNGWNLNLLLYIQEVWSVTKTIFSPSDWYFEKHVNHKIIESPLISYIVDNYIYSLTILLSSLLIAFVLGFAFALSIFFFSRKKIVFRLLNSLEALPDLIFIFALQLFVVWFYKVYGIILFEFVYLGEERIYLSPIISLSILPTILFFKVILLLLEEEWNKEYVQLAKSKGMDKFHILLHHCIRNIKKNMIIQSKPIVWATISSLLVVEYLHNFYGIVRLVFFDTRPFIIAVALALLFVPFFLIYNLLQVLFKIEEKELEFSENELLFRRVSFLSWDSSALQMKNVLSKLVFFTKQFTSATLHLIKRPKFLFGFIYLVGFVVISVSYPYIKDVPIERIGVYKDDSGEYHSPPHPPGEVLLGTDTYGYSIFDILMTGAKYTILISALIALLRIVIGYFLTIPYIFWLGRKSKFVINKIADGMQFIPLTLIAYVLLVQPVFFLERDKAIAESLILENTLLEIGILVIFVVPIMVNTLGNEADLVLKKDFNQAAIMLGGSKTRIFLKHITPHLLPKLFFLFGQQMILVLQVFMHLAVFSLFLGGTISMGGYGVSQSLLNEWTYLFEGMRMAIMTGRYWFIIPVLLLYIILIFSIQAVISSIIEQLQANIGVFPKSQKKHQSEVVEKHLVKKERQEKSIVGNKSDDFSVVSRSY
ncbi:hypothetical protein V1502_18685 [Bacillus sp. SCS-153A]|uniref:hypothetical protein n=1 Tax=Rossellomorea sedimentorum TaxID=3115294 RepID=UPI003906A171